MENKLITSTYAIANELGKHFSYTSSSENYSDEFNQWKDTSDISSSFSDDDEFNDLNVPFGPKGCFLKNGENQSSSLF